MVSTFALALSFVAGVFGPVGIPQQPRLPEKPQPSASEPAKQSEDELDVTGCLFQGQTAREFILLDAKKDPQNPYEVGVTYRLVPDDRLRLASHVTHTVRVMGVMEKKAAGVGEEEFAALKARDLKMAMGTCSVPTGDDSEEGDYSGDSHSRWFAGVAGSGYADGGMSLAGLGSGSSARTSSRFGTGMFANVSGLSSITGASGSAGLSSTTGAAGTSSLSAPSFFSAVGAAGSTSALLPAFSNIDTSAIGPAIAYSSAAVDLDYTGNALTLGASEPTAIANPEPASLVLLGTGLLLAARRFRRRATA